MARIRSSLENLEPPPPPSERRGPLILEQQLLEPAAEELITFGSPRVGNDFWQQKVFCSEFVEADAGV